MMRRSKRRTVGVEALEDRRLLSLTLDTSFSGDGWTRVDFYGRADPAMAVAVQPAANVAGHKVLLAGETRDGSDPSDWGITRLNPDGSLDTSFGKGGKVLTQVGKKYDQALAILVEADGSFYVVGMTDLTKGGFDYAKDQAIGLARYQANGALDSKFGSKGIVVTNLTSVNDSPTHARFDAQGRIVVVGSIGQAGTNTFVLRYNRNGKLDNTFASGGKYLGAHGGVNDFVIHADGSMTLATDNRLVRLNASGQLVGSFGTGGVANLTAATGATEVKRLVQQGSRLVVAENFSDRLHAFDVTSGAFDPSYQVELRALLPALPGDEFWGWFSKFDLEVDAAGRLLAVGPIDRIIPTGPDQYQIEPRLGVVRLLADGSLDDFSALDLDPARQDEYYTFPGPGDGASHVALANPADPDSALLMGGAMSGDFLAIRIATNAPDAAVTAAVAMAAPATEDVTGMLAAALPAEPLPSPGAGPKRSTRARGLLRHSE